MATSTQPTLSSLDSSDYDPISHLNAVFSHPSTLSSVPRISAALSTYEDDLSSTLNGRLSAQRSADAASVARIQATQASLTSLFRKIEGVRTRAAATEHSITDMTAEIKRLDSTKRNLTASMTALKRLQMLTTAYEQLRGLSRSRQYRECAQLLAAVMQLVVHFKSYRSIEQIATLHRNVVALQAELLEQVCDDFEKTFAQDEVSQRKGMLSEACQVMDALGDQARARLITWYCNTQLREYRQVFRGNDEAGSLDNISRRYSWFNRMLKTYDMEHASIFPAHWRVGEMLANAFCEGTRDDYKVILQRSVRRTDGQPLDVNLLLACMQETLNFEHSLEKKFVGESRSSVDTMASRDDRPQGVGQIISEAFEPYMTLWVESQDKQLAALIPTYRQQPFRNEDEEFSSQAVIPSSTELFHFYRLALAQCAKLSTGSRLLELSKTFGKYLDQYCQQVLYYFLTEKFGLNGPSLEDIIVILNTADYCYLTCNQLEEKIKSRVDEEFRTVVDLQSQADGFMGIASAAIKASIRRVEQELEPVWREMRSFPWSKLESVTDHSSYVPEMLRVIKTKVTEIMELLHKLQFKRVFCDQLVDAIAMAYIGNVCQCKPISEVGAEQMLLDSYALKKDLMDLPIIGQEPGTQPPASFVKRTTTTTTKIDSLLKTLQVRPSPPEALVQAYLIHLSDRSEPNFRKILDLKGIRRSSANHASLVDLFNAHCRAPNYAQLPAQNAWFTPVSVAPQASTGGVGLGGGAAGKDGGGGGGVKESAFAAATAGGRFDAASFGSALMSAAREGVDRLGTPGLGGGAAGGIAGVVRSTSPAPIVAPGQASSPDGAEQHSRLGGANLNENLKSLGKFFRRDTASGAFGRFGRSGDGK